MVIEETNNTGDFESLKNRLDEIVELVGDENISLDAALGLYEEAVGIGLEASSLLEEGIAAKNAQIDADQALDDGSSAEVQDAVVADAGISLDSDE